MKAFAGSKKEVQCMDLPYVDKVAKDKKTLKSDQFFKTCLMEP